MSTTAGSPQHLPHKKHNNKRAVPDLAKDADGISQEVEATYNLVELPQKSTDVVALKGVGELSTSGSGRIGEGQKDKNKSNKLSRRQSFSPPQFGN